MISLSAGSLMGGAFLHLLPASLENFEAEKAFLLVLFSFIVFFLVEKIFHWRHCHKGQCDRHAMGIMNLIGDSVHNFIDGLIISSSFLVDVRLGWVTVVAVALHEIPQEIGDFGVLLYAGWGKSKALILNFCVALMVVLGGLMGYYISSYRYIFIEFLTPFAAGGFIYIASSDLMPEIRNETSLKKSLIYFAIFILGISLMYVLAHIE